MAIVRDNSGSEKEKTPDVPEPSSWTMLMGLLLYGKKGTGQDTRQEIFMKTEGQSQGNYNDPEGCHQHLPRQTVLLNPLRIVPHHRESRGDRLHAHKLQLFPAAVIDAGAICMDKTICRH